MQSIVGVARKHMKVEVPHILIACWPIVLASRDSFAPEGISHRVCQAARGTKEVAPEAVRDVQHVLVVASRYHQAVAFYSSVVVGRNQNENVGIIRTTPDAGAGEGSVAAMLQKGHSYPGGAFFIWADAGVKRHRSRALNEDLRRRMTSPDLWNSDCAWEE